MVRLCTLWRAHAAVFKIGTIVSYRGRLHVVVGVTPMSLTPQLVEIEDRESGRIRRVPYGDLQLFEDDSSSTTAPTMTQSQTRHASVSAPRAGANPCRSSNKRRQLCTSIRGEATVGTGASTAARPSR
jgi:hypothetical protein